MILATSTFESQEGAQVSGARSIDEQVQQVGGKVRGEDRQPAEFAKDTLAT